MADWAKTRTLDEFIDMVEARWHNPQQAQNATDAMLRLDQRKYKSVRELTTTVENLIVVPVLLTMFVRCLLENLRTLLASEARLEYHTFETFSRKALDLEATLGGAQPTPVDGRKNKSPQEWKKKGGRLMMVESDGTQTEIDELSDLMDGSEYEGEEFVEGSTLASLVKVKAGGRGKGHQKSQAQAASNQSKVADWVKAGLDQDVWRDCRVRGACINCDASTHGEVGQIPSPLHEMAIANDSVVTLQTRLDQTMLCTLDVFEALEDLESEWSNKDPRESWVALSRGPRGEHFAEKGEAVKTPPEIENVVTKFPDLFAEPTGVVDREIVHAIETIPGSKTPRERIYRMAPAELDELQRQLKELTERGWIRPSTSPFGSPVLFVPKKGGSLRMCIDDYRGLNAITVKNAEPLPRIDDPLDGVQGCKHYRKIDLKSGYHQIAIRPEDQHKTAFQTRYGLYEFVVMPFGLCNAPGTFQHAMNRIFHDYLDKFVVVYLDDILVFSKSVEEYAHHLETILSLLRQHKYKVNLEKCEFGRTKILYLGHEVSTTRIRPEDAKVASIRDWPRPQTMNAEDKATKDEFVMVDGLIFLEKVGNNRLVIPARENLRSLFLGECHDAMGHFGYKKTSANLVQRFWWPGMLEDAKKYGQTCQVSQRDKPRTRAPLGLLKPLAIPARPGQSVSMDFMDTLVTSRSGKRHIFVIIDRFTKFATLIAMPNTARTEHVIKLFMDNWVRDFGLPKSIVSDRDVRFTSELWKKTAEQLGSQLQMYNKPNQDDWDEKLPLIASWYNNVVHSSTDVSPNQLHLGWKPRSALDFLLPEN
ncbi:hypothetical protein CBR_g38281 [Chara braunii]|uniref:Integrase catalytic domain-containing protein n=1 Tax=Chara braunii TaxID=69332 RepID=A0A388LPV8_CHABU|nr:hypothetical protein CBR_g38281 [Chara braunii]|eukprot:GBG84311.1 hypothetical protein CBR_g38281 [Chara braunii]